MAAVLVVVFFVCLVFAILPEIIPSISKKFVSLVVQETNDEQSLKEHLRELNEEVKGINMVDEFAKYAKTERKINSLKDELKTYFKSRNDVLLKVKLGANVIFHIVQVVLVLGLIWSFRSSSLMEIPTSWTWPLSALIAFPSGIEGAVGITWWFIVCRSAIRKCIEMVQ